MSDPNRQYKTGFAELVAKLGRTPTADECLGIHEEYKSAWGPAEETVKAPERAREGWQPVEGMPGASYRDETVTWQPLSGPGAADNNLPAVSEPERAENKPAPPERRYVAGRGPGGGVLAMCVTCGQEWERPRTRGRPAAKCEECRNG